ncbi:hypothetical protein [Chelativorans intermedius]|uniref:Coenzyme F390 synthetase n=1 Tax=Chelativorans intermedius TaxID=515947 RepID=A0ABV6D851_9HYPH|nr:hypothetical protein [Chelativorans intermedius]MCT8999882.1 hypothetical protein [Chelativorans intermedius]
MSQRPLWESASRKPEKVKERLADIVAFARGNSPYYRDLYKNVPARVEDPSLLPVTDKKTLMANFDSWVTDRKVTIERVRKFIEDPSLVGEMLLGKYLVATTAGTTGKPGIFILDDNHMRGGTSGLREAFRTWLSLGDVVRIVLRGARFAALHATGGHFVSVTGFTRARRSSRVLAKLTRDFSVDAPIRELVNGLNEFRPAVVLGYASTASLLTREQELGRLRIKPVLLVVTAEGPCGRRVRADRQGLRRKGRQHIGLNRDRWPDLQLHRGMASRRWRLDYPRTDECRFPSRLSGRAVAYRAGDQSRKPGAADPPLRSRRPRPAKAGSLPLRQSLARDPHPGTLRRGPPVSDPSRRGGLDSATRVRDRSRAGSRSVPGRADPPTNLRVRLRFESGADPSQVWQRVHGELKHLLDSNELHQVSIERAEEPPEQSKGGKVRQVIPLSGTRT